MIKVDSHAHVFSSKLKMVKQRRYTPSYNASVEEFIANFDKNGLTCGVLIQPSFLGTDNSYMIDAIRQHLDKLYGVVVVNPDIELEELQKLDKLNIIGIRLNLYGKEVPDLSSDIWQRCLMFLKKLDWHIEIHADAYILPPLVDIILASGVKVVIDHFGKPTSNAVVDDEGIKYLLSVANTRRIWVKISGVYRLDKKSGFEESMKKAKQLIPILLESFGPDRLLWGSDWPHTQFENTILYDKIWDLFNKLIPDVSVRKAILSKSFEDLLPHI